jgi:hypothetical protein
MAWFNVGSLILGLSAWILPIINLIKQNVMYCIHILV